MTERIQQKLLRVRPPRVRITYDVETGGAIEQRELPFIVGILADLSGDRGSTADLAPKPLKERKMIDIDRDNFNDIMKAVRPRVDLSKVPQTVAATASLLATPDDRQIMFEHLDDFAPMQIIRKLPTLAGMYDSRGLIRSLQAKCESDQDLARHIDTLAQSSDPGEEQLAIVAAAAPLLQADAAKTLLCLKHLAKQMGELIAEGTHAEALVAAQKHGTAAVIDELVARIDRLLSVALTAILHSPGFKQVEATWRGLARLVFNTETSATLKLRVFNATRDELAKDMDKAVEFDQSMLFKLVYEAESGTLGGAPYSLLIGGYELGAGDIAFLRKISEVAAAAHAPFITAASTEMFGLSQSGGNAGLTAWREFREMEDSRYVSLVLPRVMLRLPYGKPEKRNTMPCEGVNFEENMSGAGLKPFIDAGGEITGNPKPDKESFLWGNAAYVLAERITNAFSLYNWTAAICGVEGGGLVEDLPLYTYTSAAGSSELFCPIDVPITGRCEQELNELGFISLRHCKDSGRAAFCVGQTSRLPKKYFPDSANANARISPMLPYLLAASRFAHYIQAIMRDKIGSFMTRGQVEAFLNGWIANYVLLDDKAGQDTRAAFPLREASVVVTNVPGQPACYRATVFLKPHFQLEELRTSIRLVANLPG